MTSQRPAAGEPSGVRHHFRPPDPAHLVERPTTAEDAATVGPMPPRPWYRLIAGQWPVFVTMLVMTCGLALSAASYWRRGATIVGAGVLLGALLRAVLPERMIGLLTCRSRAIDVAVTAVVGAAIVLLAWLVDPTNH